MHTSIAASEKVCARLKEIGYSHSKSVKLYGEVLELLSDPYPDGEYFVIETRSRHSSQDRIVRIPKFIVSSAKAA